MLDGDTVTAATWNSPMETTPNQGEMPAEAAGSADNRLELAEPNQTQEVPVIEPVEVTDSVGTPAAAGDGHCAAMTADSARQAAAAEPVNPTVRTVRDRLADVSRIRFGAKTY